MNIRRKLTKEKINLYGSFQNIYLIIFFSQKIKILIHIKVKYLQKPLTVNIRTKRETPEVTWNANIHIYIYVYVYMCKARGDERGVNLCLYSVHTSTQPASAN